MGDMMRAAGLPTCVACRAQKEGILAPSLARAGGAQRAVLDMIVRHALLLATTLRRLFSINPRRRLPRNKGACTRVLPSGRAGHVRVHSAPLPQQWSLGGLYARHTLYDYSGEAHRIWRIEL